MPIELVVALCLSARPDVCEMKVFPLYEEVSLMSCMMQAQPYLAEWSTTHPEWTVKAWKCGHPRTRTGAA
jgi:hypothetical protein